MNWLCSYRAKVSCEELGITLRVEKEDTCFLWGKRGKTVSLNFCYQSK